MDNAFTFSDNLTYQAPASTDCLVVPENQWDKLHASLRENTSVARDAALWTLAGITGGGAIALFSTFFSFGAGVSDFAKEVSLGLGILLGLSCCVLFWFANKFNFESTAKSVSLQMDILKPGFRRLVASSKTEGLVWKKWVNEPSDRPRKGLAP